MKTRCTHDWKIYVTTKSDFKCKSCGLYGKNRRVWNKKKRDYEWRVIAIYV